MQGKAPLTRGAGSCSKRLIICATKKAPPLRCLSRWGQQGYAVSQGDPRHGFGCACFARCARATWKNIPLQASNFFSCRTRESSPCPKFFHIAFLRAVGSRPCPRRKKERETNVSRFFGGDNRARTCDLMHVKHAL